jgi:hypothetical protein
MVGSKKFKHFLRIDSVENKMLANLVNIPSSENFALNTITSVDDIDVNSFENCGEIALKLEETLKDNELTLMLIHRKDFSKYKGSQTDNDVEEKQFNLKLKPTLAIY